ncbi:hypothetical protein [Streptomyces gibsoniae]|uniref:Uncharacterized protein n=1 Tax=Streptomyces gibsoniae TaxID=3075529 RepID=A0ABU2U8I1_9ACTN|nr:hypothetical protein [Streptomyces sp. DSM 41699]MDT0469470.1 hypothetical protein [Streptomyces sp. DSM 41699]
MNAAMVLDVHNGYVSYLVQDTVLFVVPLAEAEFGGLTAGIWFCARKPIRIPLPGRAGLDAWVDDWFDTGSRTEQPRSVTRDNGLLRLQRSGELSKTHKLQLSPGLDAVLDASADLPGHTVAFVVLTEEPVDRAEFMAVRRRAARYPVLWGFIGAETSVERSAYPGVVDTLGREPADPDNFVIVKVNGWATVTRWFNSRRIKRAVRRRRGRTPVG